MISSFFQSDMDSKKDQKEFKQVGESRKARTGTKWPFSAAN